MTTGRDDDAFSWEGDDDPTLRAGEDVAPVVLPDGFTAVGKGSEAVVSTAEARSEARPAGEADAGPAAAAAAAPLGNAALVTLGVLGGVYLLYAIGWIIGGLRLQGVAGYLVSPTADAPPMWQSGNLVGVWLAAVAPVLWFVTVVLLTRGGRAWVRVVWLVAGALLLVPWPLLMGGAIA